MSSDTDMTEQKGGEQKGQPSVKIPSATVQKEAVPQLSAPQLAMLVGGGAVSAKASKSTVVAKLGVAASFFTQALEDARNCDLGKYSAQGDSLLRFRRRVRSAQFEIPRRGDVFTVELPTISGPVSIPERCFPVASNADLSTRALSIKTSLDARRDTYDVRLERFEDRTIQKPAVAIMDFQRRDFPVYISYYTELFGRSKVGQPVEGDRRVDLQSRAVAFKAPNKHVKGSRTKSDVFAFDLKPPAKGQPAELSEDSKRLAFNVARANRELDAARQRIIELEQSNVKSAQQLSDIKAVKKQTEQLLKEKRRLKALAAKAGNKLAVLQRENVELQETMRNALAESEHKSSTRYSRDVSELKVRLAESTAALKGALKHVAELKKQIERRDVVASNTAQKFFKRMRYSVPPLQRVGSGKNRAYLTLCKRDAKFNLDAVADENTACEISHKVMDNLVLIGESYEKGSSPKIRYFGAGVLVDFKSRKMKGFSNGAVATAAHCIQGMRQSWGEGARLFLTVFGPVKKDKGASLPELGLRVEVKGGFLALLAPGNRDMGYVAMPKLPSSVKAVPPGMTPILQRLNANTGKYYSHNLTNVVQTKSAKRIHVEGVSSLKFNRDIGYWETPMSAISGDSGSPMWARIEGRFYVAGVLTDSVGYRTKVYGLFDPTACDMVHVTERLKYDYERHSSYLRMDPIRKGVKFVRQVAQDAGGEVVSGIFERGDPVSMAKEVMKNMTIKLSSDGTGTVRVSPKAPAEITKTLGLDKNEKMTLKEFSRRMIAESKRLAIKVRAKTSKMIGVVVETIKRNALLAGCVVASVLALIGRKLGWWAWLHEKFAAVYRYFFPLAPPNSDSESKEEEIEDRDTAVRTRALKEAFDGKTGHKPGVEFFERLGRAHRQCEKEKAAFRPEEPSKQKGAQDLSNVEAYSESEFSEVVHDPDAVITYPMPRSIMSRGQASRTEQRGSSTATAMLTSAYSGAAPLPEGYDGSDFAAFGSVRTTSFGPRGFDSKMMDAPGGDDDEAEAAGDFGDEKEAGPEVEVEDIDEEKPLLGCAIGLSRVVGFSRTAFGRERPSCFVSRAQTLASARYDMEAAYHAAVGGYVDIHEKENCRVFYIFLPSIDFRLMNVKFSEALLASATDIAYFCTRDLAEGAILNSYPSSDRECPRDLYPAEDIAATFVHRMLDARIDGLRAYPTCVGMRAVRQNIGTYGAPFYINDLPSGFFAGGDDHGVRMAPKQIHSDWQNKLGETMGYFVYKGLKTPCYRSEPLNIAIHVFASKMYHVARLTEASTIGSLANLTHPQLASSAEHFRAAFCAGFAGVFVSEKIPSLMPSVFGMPSVRRRNVTNTLKVETLRTCLYPDITPGLPVWELPKYTSHGVGYFGTNDPKLAGALANGVGVLQSRRGANANIILPEQAVDATRVTVVVGIPHQLFSWLGAEVFVPDGYFRRNKERDISLPCSSEAHEGVEPSPEVDAFLI